MGGIERSVLYRSQAELLRRQVAQKRGDWRAVLPHALANRLAKRALQNIAIPDINAVLFKPENLRLLKSSAHRLGYLHDFEPARLLAESWIEKDAPLADVGSCCEDRIEALDFIAPVFPSTVLEALEVAAQNPEFTTRTNPHFSIIVRLLCKLAYEEESFSRAAALILKFAESESSDEKNDSIVSQLKQLFSLYLSGTLAKPVLRHSFVGRLLESSNPRHLEIAREIFYSALETSHWSSVSSFGFGARKRTTGWAPRTREERDQWYVGYIELLEARLHSPNLNERLLAREILSSRFRGLWSFAGCFDKMEQLVRENAHGGSWPEMWLSIKQTVFFDGEKSDPEIFERLKSLEELTAPSNAYSEIEAYVFANTWDHAEVKGGDYSQKVKVVEAKIRSLGVLAASDPELLTRLGPRLWAKHIDSLSHFGAGLADGADDQEAMFDFLTKLLQFQKQEHVHPILFFGYLGAVYDGEPRKCRLLQEKVLGIPELKPFFVYLLSAAPIAPWGAKKLVEVAQEGSLEAFRFEHLRLGRIHESICDAQLGEILRAVNDLDGGAVSTIEILGMRFFVDKDSDYVPSEEIRSIGRHAVSKVVRMHRNDVSHSRLSGEDRVLDQCFPPDSPENEVQEIIDSICDGLLEYRVYGHEIDPILAKFVENFPELVLNQVYGAGERKELLAHSLFRDRISRRRSFLNAVSVDRLLEWCAGDDQKVQFAARAVTKFVSPSGDDSEFQHPKDVVLSEHILALLEVAQNKEMIVQYIFESIRPSSHSGSEADIMQTRKIAFEELLAYPDKAIQQFAQGKVSGLEETIKRIRDCEAKEFGRREQRFE